MFLAHFLTNLTNDKRQTFIWVQNKYIIKDENFDVIWWSPLISDKNTKALQIQQWRLKIVNWIATSGLENYWKKMSRMFIFL